MGIGSWKKLVAWTLTAGSLFTACAAESGSEEDLELNLAPDRFDETGGVDGDDGEGPEEEERNADRDDGDRAGKLRTPEAGEAFTECIRETHAGKVSSSIRRASGGSARDR